MIGGTASCSTLQGLNHTSAATSVKDTTINCSNLPCGSTYHGGGEHWWASEEPHDFSEDNDQSLYTSCAPECDEVCQCAANGGFWNDPPCGDSCGCNTSPIIIDTGRGRAQYHLTSASDGVLFDVYGNDAPVRVAWTRPDSEVAFLVLDRNGNGRIDSGRELFGSSTRLADGKLAANGFVALSEFDANRDGHIDAADPVFSQLRLWFDRNHNGVSEPSEFESLVQNGIVAIETSFTESGRVDRYGNWFRYVGTMLVDGRKRDREVRIYDVYCTTKSANTTR